MRDLTLVNCQHCAKCAHIHSERTSHQETANTVQNVHAQHSEGSSHQETDSTVKNVHTYNILKDLQVRGLMALLKICTQNILKDLQFRELVVFSGKIKNVKEGRLVLRKLWYLFR